jgi:hypothetical protein
MPPGGWTPARLAPLAHAWQVSGWRAVEAQHRVATLVLTGGRLDDQALLEDILDRTAKPPMPQAAGALHWLLATPFRHHPARSGSRFRRRGDPGVFYGAEARRTAAAEAGYWRLRFWLDSEGLAARPAAVEMTLFEFHACAAAAIDLARPPLAADAGLWTDATDYAATQALAATARDGGLDAIRYASVRDAGGLCVALLSPAPFHAIADPYRHVQQTFSLFLAPPDTVLWQRQLEDERWTFRFPTGAFGEPPGTG